MEVKLDGKFFDQDGKEMDVTRHCVIELPDGTLKKDPNGNTYTKLVDMPEHRVTLKKVCINSLIGNYQGDNPDQDEKYRRFLLMQKFGQANGSIDLTANEIVDLKKVISMAYGILVMGQAYLMLDGKQPEPVSIPEAVTSEEE